MYCMNMLKSIFSMNHSNKKLLMKELEDLKIDELK
jgi:hypothetical protein